ncbi:unnamed protein product [Protopolystoma xenopodis]|uniref:Uncharacterized protein n=1 Tax=Protopolystoma xenopodis TaxID=117903 RepID=A0A3S5C3M0_9PLAT|nr:unnamed protein product [Protopolystoma xenopodis]
MSSCAGRLDQATGCRDPGLFEPPLRNPSPGQCVGQSHLPQASATRRSKPARSRSPDDAWPPGTAAGLACQPSGHGPLHRQTMAVQRKDAQFPRGRHRLRGTSRGGMPPQGSTDKSAPIDNRSAEGDEEASESEPVVAPGAGGTRASASEVASSPYQGSVPLIHVKPQSLDVRGTGEGGHHLQQKARHPAVGHQRKPSKPPARLVQTLEGRSIAHDHSLGPMRGLVVPLRQPGQLGPWGIAKRTAQRPLHQPQQPHKVVQPGLNPLQAQSRSDMPVPPAAASRLVMVLRALPHSNGWAIAKVRFYSQIFLVYVHREKNFDTPRRLTKM